MATNAPWSGQWVADRLGVALHGDGLHDLLGLALRRNPKRAHLLVSHVLGKHVPQRPDVVHGHGCELGERVRDLLGPDEAGAGGRARLRRDRDRPRARGRRRPRRRALPALHPPAGARRPPRTAASRRSTATPPATCCCPRTRRCSPAPARWSWSTTSSPPARPSSTPSAPCTTARRAAVTSWSPSPTCARPPTGPASTPSPQNSAPASTWWPSPPAPSPSRRGCSTAGQALVAAHERPAGPGDRRGRRPPRPCGGWTWAGPPGCPTADGTASCPGTGSCWRRRCPPWASGWPPHCRPPRAGCSSSATRS